MTEANGDRTRDNRITFYDVDPNFEGRVNTRSIVKVLDQHPGSTCVVSDWKIHLYGLSNPGLSANEVLGFADGVVEGRDLINGTLVITFG